MRLLARLDDLHEHLAAGGAAPDDPRAADVHDHPRDLAPRAAVGARAERAGHLDAEHLEEQAAERVSVEASRSHLTSRRSEPFGLHSARVVAELDESRRRRLDERASGRTRTPARRRPPATRPRASSSRVDPPRVAVPAVRLRARQRVDDLEPVTARALELVPVDHVLPRARRVQQPHRRVAPDRGPVAQHRHQRDDARAAGDEQERAAVGRRPRRTSRRSGRASRTGRRARASSARYGDTSPSSSRSTVIVDGPAGRDAIE